MAKPAADDFVWDTSRDVWESQFPAPQKEQLLFDNDNKRPRLMRPKDFNAQFHSPIGLLTFYLKANRTK
jgi:hypothetical protein